MDLKNPIVNKLYRVVVEERVEDGKIVVLVRFTRSTPDFERAEHEYRINENTAYFFNRAVHFGADMLLRPEWAMTGVFVHSNNVSCDYNHPARLSAFVAGRKAKKLAQEAEYAQLSAH